MTSEWLTAFPSIARPFLDQLDHTVSAPLSTIMSEGPNSALTATENAQPAIFATSVLILRILEQAFGFKTADTIDFTLGHSLGEFAALVAGGYLDTWTAVDLVRRRAQVMARVSRAASAASPNGETHEVGMVALVCEAEQRDHMIAAIEHYLDPRRTSRTAAHMVTIANINSKNQIVLAGGVAQIKTLLVNLRQFAGHDPRAVRLSCDSAFHSPIMAPATEFMRRSLEETVSAGENGAKIDKITFPGHFPCVSNVSARPFADKKQLKDHLSRQASETVLWHKSIQFLDRQERVRRWIGIGPGKVGRNLVGKEVGMKGAVKGGGVWGINEPGDIETVMRALEATELFDEDDVLDDG